MPEFVLGIDWGSRRIGLALGQLLTGQARPLITVANNGAFESELQHLIQEWNIKQLILGLPYAADGSEQEVTRRVRNFAKKLQQLTGLETHLVDERYTSFAAEREFQQRRADQRAKAKDKSLIDAIAAQIILQSWLDEQKQPV